MTAAAFKTRVNPDTGKLERYHPSRPGYRREYYDSAKSSRLTADWANNSNATADKAIRGEIGEMRKRSRDAERNDGYVERFLKEMETNIVGPDGIAFSSKVRKLRGGGFSASDVEKIEHAWHHFSKRGQFDVTRQYSRPEFERMVVRSVARDGQFLVREVEGIEKSAFRFMVQGFEADCLDHLFDDDENNIRMGIERDEWEEPIAYHLLEKAPRTQIYSAGARDHARVEADNLLHLFISHRINQSCGVPWTNAALERLKHLRGYEEATVIAARIQASNPTYFERSEAAGEFTGDKNADGSFDVPVEPGGATILPDGYSANAPLPTQPDPNYPEFRKGILRGAVASLYVNYNTVGNDLEGVSFSSIRSGTLSERAIWEVLQNWFIEEFETPIFLKWLRMAILTRQLDLNIAELDRFCECQFNGRRWPWVDPTKDLLAAEKEIELNLNSKQNLAREKGRDLNKITDEQAADKDTIEKKLGEPESEAVPAAEESD